MPVTAALIMGGASLVGSGVSGFFGSSASKSASDAQVQAQRAALAQQMKLFETTQNALQPLFGQGADLFGKGQGLFGTGLDIMGSASPTLKRLLTPGPDQTAALSELPGFKFAQDWGGKAIMNQGSAMGLGGNVLKAGADYATGAAQQGFGGLVDRLQAMFGGGLNAATAGGNLAYEGLSGGGGAGNALASAATGAATTQGNTLGNIGQAQGSGILGSANAISNAATGGANAIGNSYLMSQYLAKNNQAPTTNSPYAFGPGFDASGNYVNRGTGIYSGV